MNILIIGNGGREAAILKYLIEKSKNPNKNQYFTTTDFFLSDNVKVCSVPIQNHPQILDYIKENKIGLVIIGPEQPLVEGLSDYLRQNDIIVFGPSQLGAKLEYSKLFCKEFLNSAQIKTSKYLEVFGEEDLLLKSKQFESPWVVKIDGPAGGKGVFISQNQSELESVAQSLYSSKETQSQRIFLEEFTSGNELSFLILTNGKDFQTLPICQDHKRLLDGDLGPNTGGMGAVAPVEISEKLNNKIINEIIKKFLNQLSLNNIDYRGVIYFGLMITPDGSPSVLEINARFGDPEAQCIFPLLKNNSDELFLAVAKGILPKIELEDSFTACVVLAAPEYPNPIPKTQKIEQSPSSKNYSENKYALFSGVKRINDDLIINSGRTINCIGVAKTAKDSILHAYEIAQQFTWEGKHFRKDIGLKVLKDDKFVFKN